MRRSANSECWAVVGLMALALAVRLYDLNLIPPGLHYDEAANGLDILDVLAGHFSIFFERNSGREPLFIYLQAISVAFLGATPFALRFTSAVVGAATVPAAYWMVREAFADGTAHSRALASWTALFVAVSYWHLNFSRIGYRAIALPLMACLAFAWFWRAWRRMESSGRLPWADLILCGAFVGGSLYTYTSSRFVPVLVAVTILAGTLTAERSKARTRRCLLALSVIGATALIVFAPLGSYFIAHPDAFAGRAAEVSVFNPVNSGGDPLGTLADSAIETAGMFFLSGDTNWRHNPAQRPVLDPVLALLLAAGLALSIVRWRSLPHFFGLSWFLVMSLPAVLSASGVPHSLRAIGMIPIVYLLPVLALSDLGRALFQRRTMIALLLPLPFLLLSGTTSLGDYFTAGQNHPGQIRGAFDADFVQLVQKMREEGRPQDAWIVPAFPLLLGPLSSHYTVDFLYRGDTAFGRVVSGGDRAPGQLAELTRGRNRAVLVKFLGVDLPAESAYVYNDPKGLIAFLLTKHGTFMAEEKVGDITYMHYRLPASSDYRVDTAKDSADALFGGKVRLLGAAFGHAATGPLEEDAALDLPVVPSGSSIWATLRWSADAPIDYDLKTTLYLNDADGHWAGQVDDLLVGNRYPLSRTWQTGELADTYHILPTLPAVPPGRYSLYLGVYDVNSKQRYAVTPPGGGAPSPALLLGSVEVTPALRPGQATPDYPLAPETVVAPGLGLIGYDRVSGPLSPGDLLPITLYWQARAAPLDDLIVSVRLEDQAGREVAKQQARPGGRGFPTTAWRSGETVRDWHDLVIPVTLPEGDYSLVVSAAGSDGKGGGVTLGTVQVRGRPRDFVRPTMQHPLDFRLGQTIRLIGYDLDAYEIRAGGELRLTLYWQSEEPTDRSYTVFAQLLDASGVLRGQQDVAPGRGDLPTSGWAPGEYVTDPHEIVVPPGISAGEFTLVVGMYDPSTGARLPVQNAAGQRVEDRVLLPQLIRVTP